MSIDRIDKFTGCMLGLAIGDALGAPVEGMKSGHIRQLVGEVEDYLNPVELWPTKPNRWRLKSLYTDDTQQALVLADVLIENGRMDAGAMAEYYVQMLNALKGERFYFGCHRGTGANFRRAVQRMADGEDPFQCGEPSAGLGGAMRIAPLGLYYMDDPDTLMDAVIEATLPTHTDPRGLAGAAAMARAVALLAQSERGEALDREEACEEIVSFTHAFEQKLKSEYWDYLDPETRILGASQMSETLDVLAPAVREGNDDIARRSIVAAANRCRPATPITDANVGFAPASVTAALYYGLRYNAFSHGVLAAINDGRDTDTVGAMTGTLLGARFGKDAIPEAWIANLVNAEQVILRGETLASGEIDWERRQNLVQMERELTRREIDSLADKIKDYHSTKAKEEKQRPPKAKSKPKPKPKPASHLPPGYSVPTPPEWIAGGAEEPEPLSPLEKKKGSGKKKRIKWKEERRRKKRSDGFE